MNAQQKITIECELLRLDHEVRHATNNENAFRFQASMQTDEGAKKRLLQVADLYAKDRAATLGHIASRKALIEAHEYHALTVREAPKDRAWAERLSAA